MFPPVVSEGSSAGGGQDCRAVSGGSPAAELGPSRRRDNYPRPVYKVDTRPHLQYANTHTDIHTRPPSDIFLLCLSVTLYK